MKTILVATDFSRNAENALSFAILLAQKIKAKIILFNAFQIPIPIAEVPYNLLEEELKSKKEEANNKLRAESEKIRHAGGVNFEYYTKEGDALDTVLEFAKSRYFDYIIMGTKGSGKHKSSVFGSTTSRLMAKTDTPIIAIPESAHFGKEIRKMTFATNYVDTDVRAIAKLSDLASALNAQVNVLHISESKVSADEQASLMKDFMKKVNAETNYNNLSFQIMPGENPEERLEQYINDHDADIIVMSTHLRNSIERLFGGSLTKKIALTTKIPLIVFHHHKEASLKLTP
jgi:nucleotide-binding universal stress UspA family protein